MSEVFTGYTAKNRWKSLNLWSRNLAFCVDYISHILEYGNIQDGDKVVEFGCGQGHKLESMSLVLSKNHLSGIELSPEMIQKAGVKRPSLEITQGDVTQIDDIPDNIDVACYLQSLHHLSIKERTLAAKVMYDKLNDGGRIVVIESLKPEVGNHLYEVLNRAYAILGHHPGGKHKQVYHSLRSFVKPGDYNPEDYGYFSPSRHDVLGEDQLELFCLKTQITPFAGMAVSDILIFEKR